ncbi:hypothetical protein ACELLULO517_00220 [Acidisoma cellulosilytica]|uniref:DUF4239 domain-containing protein n=1 Tax=Acidisoma cellulosilyticum TaxID=2802395 RepID=A0A963YWW8_9PROT|nr:hypothetical protein [Acidisoma cellulosilyticum]MCB8878638.1 hypothetical protein [Acidisoma cellulosilyticum]
MPLRSPWISLVALVLMVLAVGAGAATRRRWPEYHANRETIELLQTTVMLLATFAAIVLGLLINSAKSDFDGLDNDIRSFASSLVQLDYGLEELGPTGVPIRQDLARYTAAAITADWRSQAPPSGNYFPHLQASHTPGVGVNTPVLGQLLEHVSVELDSLAPTSPVLTRHQISAQRLMSNTIAQRWKIVSASMGTLSTPFFAMLLFWMLVIYLCFGVSAPLNHINAMALFLSALALTSALFVIIDLNTPFSGAFTVDSAPMRSALDEMLHQPDGTPPAMTP